MRIEETNRNSEDGKSRRMQGKMYFTPEGVTGCMRSRKWREKEGKKEKGMPRARKPGP